ncbi:MAG: hypothetical protein ABW171_09860, partial [Steroidobacter sp.]
AAAFREDPEIALREAMTVVNVTNHAVVLGDWSRVDAMLARLDALRSVATFREDRDIALEEAKAAFNVTIAAGSTGDWSRVCAMLARLDALRSTAVFRDNREIALVQIRAIQAMTHHAPEDSARRAQALLLQFHDDSQVQFEASLILLSIYTAQRTSAAQLNFVTTTAAANAAHVVFTAAGNDSAEALRIPVLQVIRDCYVNDPSGDCARHYELCRRAGVDFNQVPDWPQSSS